MVALSTSYRRSPSNLIKRIGVEQPLQRKKHKPTSSSIYLLVILFFFLLEQSVTALENEISTENEKYLIESDNISANRDMYRKPELQLHVETDVNNAVFKSDTVKIHQQILASSSVLQTPFLTYYGACYLAGAASSSIRWVMNPLELVKVRMQIAKHQYPNIMEGFRVIIHESGFRGLFQGLGPTAIAYMFQTGTKYGTYELFKDIVIPTMVTPEIGAKYPGLVCVGASACAEAVADVLMCPWEMLKVKIQTAGVVVATSACTAKVGVPAFPLSTIGGLLHMIKYRKEYNFPFGSLGPLWMRQIPGTVVNFYTFENVSKFIFQHILGRDQIVKKRKKDYSVSTQFAVTLVSGYISGFLSSVVSHPADSIVSLMNQPKYKGSSILQIIQEVGFSKLALQGLGPRIIVTSKIICFQWILYDFFKNLLVGTNNIKLT